MCIVLVRLRVAMILQCVKARMESSDDDDEDFDDDEDESQEEGEDSEEEDEDEEELEGQAEKPQSVDDSDEDAVLNAARTSGSAPPTKRGARGRGIGRGGGAQHRSRGVERKQASLIELNII